MYPIDLIIGCNCCQNKKTIVRQKSSWYDSVIVCQYSGYVLEIISRLVL